MRKIVEVPRHEADSAEARHDDENDKAHEKGSAASGASLCSGAKGMVVVMVHLNGAVSPGVSRRRGFDDDSLAGLSAISSPIGSAFWLLTDMLVIQL